MKKYLPIVIFAVGLLVFVGGFVFVRSRQSSPSATPSSQDESVAEIPFEKRPFVTLTPTADGHYLVLNIENIKVDNASVLDYELLYQVADGRTQGVPGSIKLGESKIEKELLLGSESSGKYRYDEGVETGTLTLRFRNDKGKLVGKLATDWHLQSNTKDLSSVDGKFTFTLNSVPKGVFFVTMQTFGFPDTTEEGIPFGIFSSDEQEYEGLDSYEQGVLFRWNGSSVEMKGVRKTGWFLVVTPK